MNPVVLNRGITGQKQVLSRRGHGGSFGGESVFGELTFALKVSPQTEGFEDYGSSSSEQNLDLYYALLNVW